jgi:hypothetical protein
VRDRIAVAAIVLLVCLMGFVAWRIGFLAVLLGQEFAP